MTFISIALVDIIPDGIAAQANQQPDEDLRLLMPSILGEASLTKIILVGGLKI